MGKFYATLVVIYQGAYFVFVETYHVVECGVTAIIIRNVESASEIVHCYGAYACKEDALDH